MRNTPRFLIASFIAIALIVSVFLLRGLYVQKKPPQGVANTLSHSPTNSEWKTYKNDEYGFTIKYPPAWFVQMYLSTTGPVEDFQLLFDRKPIPEKMEALTHGWPELTIEVRQRPHDFDMLRSPISANETKIDDVKFNQYRYLSTQFLGINAAKIVSTSEALPASGPDTSIYFNSKGYGWTIRHPNSDYQGNHDPLYDQILSTFRFTN